MNIHHFVKQLRTNLAAFTVCTKNQKSGRVELWASKNKVLFLKLSQIGFFKFYNTNHGHVVGLSQVVAYLSYGYKAFLNGFTCPKGEVEVHHINGVVDDNRSENLIYLSKQDHQLVSSVSFTPSFGWVRKIASTPFNQQGKAVVNASHFLINVIQQTLNSVAIARSGHSVKVNYSQILLCLPTRLWKSAVQYWLPRNIIKPILQFIQP